MDFVDKVELYIEENHLLEDGDGVVIGLSGGADSVSLLLTLCELRKRKNLRLAAVHLNHMIRGEEAERDEAFARRLCEDRGVLYEGFRENIPLIAGERGQSEEETGRIVRYGLFEKVRCEKGFQKIAVAHNRNDLAETVLFNMARGSSIKGLSGIQAKRGCIIRPLLGMSRKEIELYLEKAGQDYVTDSTNSENEYSRNLIRHSILPVLEKLNSGAALHIARAAEDADEIYSYIEEEASRVAIRAGQRSAEDSSGATASAAVDIDEIRNRNRLVRYEIYLMAMERLAGKRKDITRAHLGMVDELTGLESGKSFDLPYGIRARRSYGELIFERKTGHEEGFTAGELQDSDDEQPESRKPQDSDNEPPESMEQQDSVGEGCRDSAGDGKVITGDGSYILGEGILTASITDYSKDMAVPGDEYNKIFDYGRICGKLCFRYPEQDDYIRVTADGNKKLSRVFTDKKVDREKRKKIPVLAVGNEVIWAVGVRFSEGFKVDGSTKKVMILKYNSFPEEG